MILRGLISALALLVILFIGFSYRVSKPIFSEVRGEYTPEIAARADALTFARTRTALILVSKHLEGSIRGVNLTAIYGHEATQSLITLVNRYGLDGIAKQEGEEEVFALSDLLLPVHYQGPHIAVGTNFKEHADEIYHDDPPFLFPKLVTATGWNADVPYVSRLDYEAELCLFPLEDIAAGVALPTMGLVLCNDFTDRWTLVTQIDLDQPMGLTGFPAGKGCEGCLPTGYLAVVPRSGEFYLSIELSLYVNDVLRQRYSMEDMIWPAGRIVDEAFAQSDAKYMKGDQAVSLLPAGRIAQGSLILAGTAAGVIFKPANIWYHGFYLQDADVVRTEATFLGHMSNRIRKEIP